ncbi:MAG: hypothetical protein OEV44_00365 [Spirochaetota bacterium]|nr:hypothetical protein [Spirochaetota bacterium]
MATIKDILLDFVQIWSNQNKIYSVQCIVKSVDIAKRICICTPVDGSADILNVRLEADINVNSEDEPINSNPKGCFIVPKVDSLVGVTFLSKTEAFINIWTEIEGIIVKTTTFTFNDGSYGGLIKISDLVDRLKDYETLLTQLKTDFNSWTPVWQDGGLALKTILSAGYLTKTIPSSQISEFENDKIIHG